MVSVRYVVCLRHIHSCPTVVAVSAKLAAEDFVVAEPSTHAGVLDDEAEENALEEGLGNPIDAFWDYKCRPKKIRT